MKMITRSLLAIGLVLVGALVAQAARPNVVLILVDDLGWRDLGVTGSDFYQTPHVDRLFASGTHFTRAYASCQVCSPTRASLMTGKSPARHGITDWIGAASGAAWKRNTPALPAEYVHALPADDTTLAEALSGAGYKTFFAGKWHLGGEGSLPTDHGFDINLGGHHSGSPPGGYFSPYNNPKLPDGPPGEHLPLRLARETASFIEETTEQPFFAMLSFYSVHGPLQTTRERWEANRQEALAKGGAKSRFAFDRTKPVRQVQDHPVYAGMVEVMDDAVGLVLDAIERSGQRDETIVLFTSDNGGVSSGDGRATSNLPLRGGKGRQWEGGLRVPLAIAWPGKIRRGRRVGYPAITTDLYPTILDLCGLLPDPEQTIDGVSLADAMNGLSGPERALVWHYPHYGNQGGEPSSIIRMGQWKLIRYHEDGREELYDLSADEGEQIDLADRETSLVFDLGTLLNQRLKALGARHTSVNPDFDVSEVTQAIRAARTQGLKAEENSAKQLLNESWKPNETWWGSEPNVPESK